MQRGRLSDRVGQAGCTSSMRGGGGGVELMIPHESEVCGVLIVL